MFILVYQWYFKLLSIHSYLILICYEVYHWFIISIIFFPIISVTCRNLLGSLVCWMRLGTVWVIQYQLVRVSYKLFCCTLFLSSFTFSCSMFPRSTHETFSTKLFQNFRTHPRLERTKFSETDFTLSHYAGKVCSILM